MSEHYCEICDVKFSSDVDRDQHLKGKRHKTAAYHHNRKKRQENDAARKIFVNNIGALRDPKESKLKYYFSSFGSVKTINVLSHSNAAIVEFHNASSVSSVLAMRQHLSNGTKFYVKQFVIHDRGELRKKREKVSEIKSQEKVMHILMTAQDFEDQMKKLSSSLNLTPEDWTQRKHICDNLTQIFSPYFHSCQVHQFGSSINGFGIIGCDLDLFIEINEKQLLSQKPKVALPYHKDLAKFLQNLTHGPLDHKNLENIKPYDMVKLLSRILTSKRTEFSEVTTVPSSRCPIIKFSHCPTGVQCDLSLNNRAALLNSRLLHLYSTVPKVHHIVSVVRRWAKAQGLAATPHASHLLSSYATTWLVLFYLQSVKPAVIPTVSQILDIIPGAEEVKVQGFIGISVSLDASLATWSHNTMTTVELLKGFFKFYTKEVCFEEEVLLTQNLTRLSVKEVNKLPGYENLQVTFMTVADPFILSHNITRSINEKTRERILVQMAVAVELISHWSSPPAARLEAWGVTELLTPQKDPPHLLTTVSKKQHKIQANLDLHGPPVLSFSVSSSHLQKSTEQGMTEKKVAALIEQHVTPAKQSQISEEKATALKNHAPKSTEQIKESEKIGDFTENDEQRKRLPMEQEMKSKELSETAWKVQSRLLQDLLQKVLVQVFLVQVEKVSRGESLGWVGQNNKSILTSSKLSPSRHHDSDQNRACSSSAIIGDCGTEDRSANVCIDIDHHIEDSNALITVDSSCAKSTNSFSVENCSVRGNNNTESAEISSVRTKVSNCNAESNGADNNVEKYRAKNSSIIIDNCAEVSDAVTYSSECCIMFEDSTGKSTSFEQSPSTNSRKRMSCELEEDQLSSRHKRLRQNSLSTPVGDSASSSCVIDPFQTDIHQASSMPNNLTEIEMPKSMNKDQVTKSKTVVLILSGIVSVVVWRDRTKMKKLLRKKDLNLSAMCLDKAVTLTYLEELVENGIVPAEVAGKVRQELDKPVPNLSCLSDVSNTQSVKFDMTVSEEIGSENSSDLHSIKQSINTTTLSSESRFLDALKDVSCSSQPDRSRCLNNLLRIDVKPHVTTAAELNYFQLFFESFKGTILGWRNRIEETEMSNSNS